MPYDGTGLDEATKVLLEARRLVEEGWCQGAYEDAAGRVCLHRALNLGSLAISATASWSDCEVACNRVSGLIPARYARARDDSNKIQPWNDAPDRTQAEVLALLDLAIVGGDG